jgi:hypothetical protein
MKEDAVILYNDHDTIKVSGSIIDCFEYYFCILEHNPNIKLVLINFSHDFLNFIFDIIKDKYVLDDLDWKKNIWFFKKYDIIKYRFRKVLVIDYSTIKKTKGLLVADEIFVITEYFTQYPDYFYDKNIYNVTYYTEMPFEYCDVPYKLKLLFDRFKPIEMKQKGIYVHSPFNPNLDQIPEELGLDDRKPIYYKKLKHMDDLFAYFDEYIYYHVDMYFDTHPRMPLECTFYNKKVKYIKNNDTKDGSYYRFKDLEENGLKDRFLNKDDEIVQQFI